MSLPELRPALDRPDLLAPPVRAALAALPRATSERVLLGEIDPQLSDTAAFCARYQVAPSDAVNCVVLRARGGGEERFVAGLVRASHRLDVNGAVRGFLAARKVSFAAREDAVAATGMEFGAITPFGLPPGWLVLLEEEIGQLDRAVVGSGMRRSKLWVPGAVLAALPGAQVVGELSRPAPAAAWPAMPTKPNR